MGVYAPIIYRNKSVDFSRSKPSFSPRCSDNDEEIISVTLGNKVSGGCVDKSINLSSTSGTKKPSLIRGQNVDKGSTNIKHKTPDNKQEEPKSPTKPIDVKQESSLALVVVGLAVVFFAYKFSQITVEF